MARTDDVLCCDAVQHVDMYRWCDGSVCNASLRGMLRIIVRHRGMLGCGVPG